MKQASKKLQYIVLNNFTPKYMELYLHTKTINLKFTH